MFPRQEVFFLALMCAMQGKREADETLKVTVEIADTLYAHASVKACEEVYLWLGVSFLSRATNNSGCLKESSG